MFPYQCCDDRPRWWSLAYKHIMPVHQMLKSCKTAMQMALSAKSCSNCTELMIRNIPEMTALYVCRPSQVQRLPQLLSRQLLHTTAMSRPVVLDADVHCANTVSKLLWSTATPPAQKLQRLEPAACTASKTCEHAGMARAALHEEVVTLVPDRCRTAIMVDNVRQESQSSTSCSNQAECL